MAHYRGATISIEMEIARETFPVEIKDFLVDFVWLEGMNQAAVYLKTKEDLSVAEIAGRVGYDSPSKFAIAFRKEMGASPTEYRNQMKE